MADGAHDHALVPHTHSELEESPDIYNLQQALLMVDARLDALEAEEPTDPPDPPDPPGTNPPVNLQAAIDAAPSGGTVNATGGTYSGRFKIAKPLTLIGATINAPAGGTLGTPGLLVTGADVTLDKVTVKGAKNAFAGIIVDRGARAKVINCTVTDVVYVGIMTIGATNGLIRSCTVKGVVPLDSTNSWNAYGIVATYTSGSGNSTDILIENCLVENVPSWHAYDTHAGVRITFRNCTSRSSRMGVFPTTSPTNCVVEGCTFISPTAAEKQAWLAGPWPDTYSQDVRGCAVAGGTGVFRNNIGTGWASNQWWRPAGDASGWTTPGNTPAIP